MTAMRRLFAVLMLVAVSTIGQGYWDRTAYHFAGGDSPAVDRTV